MNDFSNLCRICLCDGASIPIFNTTQDEFKDIGRWVNLCLCEKIEDIPGYPRNICETCHMTVNDIIAFQNKYKETCELLKQTCLELSSQVVVKQEYEEIGIEYSNVNIENFDSPDVSDVELGNVKPEFKIAFSDAKQFEELVKPLVTKAKKEPRTRKKQISKLSMKKKPSTKKNNEIVVINRRHLDNRIASSILEGEFVFTGEKWCIKTPNEKEKAKQKAKQISSKEPKAVTTSVDIPIKKTQKCNKVPEPRLCELCGSTFSSAEKLKRHVDSHHREKATVKCPKCPKILANKSGLQKHMKRNHSERPKVICPVCGKGYAFETELRVHHKRTHLKQRPSHACKLCDRKYATAKSLLVHERAVHTGERPEVCTVCDARFTHTDYLNEHMRLHTGDTPFKCPVCGRGYAQRCNMRSHVKYNHRISQLDEETLKTIKPIYLKLMKP